MLHGCDLMLKFSHIKQAEQSVDKEVTIAGWVHRKRQSGGVAFIIMRDSTGTMQIAVKKDKVDAASWKAVTDTTIESSIIAEGIVKEDKRAPTGFELEAANFSNTGISEPFPITEFQSTELLLDKRHLWLRSQKMTGILKARAYLFKYLRDFLSEKQFWEVTPPIITKAGGEGGADMFAIDFFGTKAYLTQSSQLYLEALVPVLEHVYDLVPSFRAEKSRTVKHLAEYWHLEVEAGYYSQEDNMKLQEDMIEYVCQRFVKEQGSLLQSLNVDANRLSVVKAPFKRLTYDEALKQLKQNGIKKEWLDDIGAEDEKVLTEKEEKPIFIYKWPLKIKAFYMREDPDNPEFALCSDMQAPHGHGEIVGSSERVYDYKEMADRLNKYGLQEKDYYWYTDIRKYGTIPHSGFGLGVERLLKWMLDLDHIRDAIPFPRMANRVEP